MNEDEAVQVLDNFAEYLDGQIIRPAVDDITSALSEVNRHVPKSIREMLGEYLRDAAVLVLIFVPVDILIPRYINKQTIAARWLLATLGLSAVMLVLGIWVERRS
ncbi:MAG: hypothetical protein ABR881_00830 [Candidatus Sulfotelmatobacter sp.]|jgi:hypothetical protein